MVVAGCETHVCLMQTAHGLQRAGFQVWVAATACGTRFPADHDLALARLRQSGAVLASVEMIAFEWLRTCENERFREVHEILRRRAAEPSPGAAPLRGRGIAARKPHEFLVLPTRLRRGCHLVRGARCDRHARCILHGR